MLFLAVLVMLNVYNHWSSSVISVPTVRISFGPYSARPTTIPIAPTIITQSGIAASAQISLTR